MSKPYVPYGTKRYRDRDRDHKIDSVAGYAFFTALGTSGTVEHRYNDRRYNDIPDITMNIILCPGKSYSKMYGSEPQYNDTSKKRYNFTTPLAYRYIRVPLYLEFSK